jgi:pimeloyl-ACP methyl ester carboxylesterase
MNTVTSADGTRIAYDCSGSGPAVILVDGALCRRAFGPMTKLAALLSRHFTVVTYDRRGRGDSADVGPYAVSREIDDLAALIEVAGGSAALYGASSGGALSMEAVASGLSVTRLAIFEPPFVSEGGSGPQPDHLTKLRQLLANERRGDAVRYFMRDMLGAPAAVVAMMRLLFPVWSKLEAVAHTLPYDATIMGSWTVPIERAALVRVPTLVLDGEKSDVRLKRASKAVAAAIAGAEHRGLVGQSHNAAASAIAPELIEFFGARAAETTPAHVGASAHS